MLQKIKIKNRNWPSIIDSFFFKLQNVMYAKPFCVFVVIRDPDRNIPYLVLLLLSVYTCAHLKPLKPNLFKVYNNFFIGNISSNDFIFNV